MPRGCTGKRAAGTKALSPPVHASRAITAGWACSRGRIARVAGCLPREVEASRLGSASVSSSATTATRVALRLGRAVVRWGSNGELKRGGACSMPALMHVYCRGTHPCIYV